MMIQVKEFGSVGTKTVEAVTLSGRNGFQVTVLTLGATIQRIHCRDAAGVERDVCLGYDSVQEYLENDGYFGASIGRCGNRISGASFVLDGTRWNLTANEGKNQLHGGKEGFDRKIWSFRQEGENTAVFSLVSPDGEEGFPGTLRVEVRYSVDDQEGLTIDYQAVSDRDTVVNLTNHCYFNLNGAGSGDILHHMLRIAASRYTPADSETIPTGELSPVQGTALDFRQGKTIGQDIAAAELAPFGGYDTNLSADGSGLRQIACLTGDKSGISMTVSTTLEGVQLYTGNFITRRRGKGGREYNRYGAVCLETQHYPDAVNKPQFPTPVLKAGEKYHEITVYRFSREV